MHTTIRLLILALLLLVPSPVPAEAQTVAELDRYWAEMSRTVEEGDFAGYSRLYHPDAVVIDQGSGRTAAIADQLAAWEEGIRATAGGEVEASVSFRFTQRLHDETTAHETGIFRYANTPRGGVETVAFIHFEALLVRKDGSWLMLMEDQERPATVAEWEAAR